MEAQQEEIEGKALSGKVGALGGIESRGRRGDKEGRNA